MRYPPVKTIEAVVRGGIMDYRTKRSVTHFRHFFRCFDDNGELTSDPNEVVRVEPTQRCLEYHKSLAQAA